MNNQLHFVGSSVVVDAVLRLTEAKNDQIAAVWFKEKIPITNNFQTSFVFKISNHGADGFAFVIHDSAAGCKAIGGGGGGKGYEKIEKSLAIQINTYENYALNRDPNGNHISVHSRGTNPNSAHHQYALCCSKYGIPTLADGKDHIIFIKYENNVLSVYLDHLSDPVCSTKVDISKLINSEKAWFGFSAATGGLNQRHEISSWKLQVPTSSISPLILYLIPEKPNLSAVMKKIEGYNTKAAVKLTEQDISQLNSIITILKNSITNPTTPVTVQHLNTIEKIFIKWPEEELFPVIDLLRALSSHSTSIKPICSYSPFAGQKDIIQRILKSLMSNIYSSQSVSLKFFINVLSIKDLHPLIQPYLNEIIKTAVTQCEKIEKKQVKDSLLILLFNCVLYIKENNITSFSNTSLVLDFVKKIDLKDISNINQPELLSTVLDFFR